MIGNQHNRTNNMATTTTSLTTTPINAAGQQTFQHPRLSQPPTTQLKHAAKLDQEEPTQQMSRLTKWLCAIIFALVLVILTLVLVDRPMVAMRNSRANKFPERIAQYTPVSSAGGGEAGRLLAAGSDERLMMMPNSDSLDDHSHDEEEHDDSPDPTVNQIPVPGRPRSGPRSGGMSNKVRDSDDICMSPGCVRAAAQILNNMDNQTRPCDDFYQFACGRWIQTQVIPDEKTSLSVFSQNTADLNIKLRALIERPARDDDPPIVGQMRNMYASCMNLSDIEARGDEPLLDVLRDLGGWPVLATNSGRVGLVALMSKRDVVTGDLTNQRPQANRRTRANSGASSGQQQQQLQLQSTRSQSQLIRRQTNGDEDESANAMRDADGEKQRNWLDIIIKFRQRGFSHDMIIDLSVVPDVRNSRRYIIELDQSSLGLPDRSYYFKGMNDTTVIAYYNLMVESAVMLGADRAEARRQMLEALEFETSLAKISVPREQRRNVARLYNKMLARDLYKLAPNIDWQRYLRTLLKDDQLDMDRDEVIVKTPNFLKQLDLLLQTTEPKIVANYMIWRIVRHSMGGLSRRWRELAHGYSMVTTGRQVEEPRWEQCLGSIDGVLGTALSALYVKNHFNGRSKAAALEMVEYIREEFLKMLDEIDWMDEETREEAKLKARAIASYIGYPDELLQDELVEELYKGVQLARTNFYQNVRDLRIWSTDYAFSQLRKPNKRGDWKKHARAAVVNAYYNSLENSIEFPAGILQGAFFDAERPNYMNFGAIGYVIGHEITHGFDDRGRQFDKDGNDRNWWKPKTDARFKERAQCIIDQYGNSTLR